MCKRIDVCVCRKNKSGVNEVKVVSVCVRVGVHVCVCVCQKCVVLYELYYDIHCHHHPSL